MRKASSGFSADTMMVDVAVTRGGIANDERYVLRTESPESAGLPGAGPGLAGRDRAAVPHHGRAGAPLRRPRRADDRITRHDVGVLGTPFFVMGFVGGQVPVEDPPYTTAGFFLDVAPADRTRMIERGLGTLARVHALDWRAAGLDLARARRGDAGPRRAARPVGGVLPGRAARPRAPARRPRVRVAARRTAALRATSGCAGATRDPATSSGATRPRCASPTSRRRRSRRRSSTSAGG